MWKQPIYNIKIGRALLHLQNYNKTQLSQHNTNIHIHQTGMRTYKPAHYFGIVVFKINLMTEKKTFFGIFSNSMWNSIPHRQALIHSVGMFISFSPFLVILSVRLNNYVKGRQSTKKNIPWHLMNARQKWLKHVFHVNVNGSVCESQF